MVLIGVCTFLSVFFGIVALVNPALAKRVRVADRIAEYTMSKENHKTAVADEQKPYKVRRQRLNDAGWLGRIEGLLGRAEVNLSVQSFVIRWVAVVGLVSFLGAMFINVLLVIVIPGAAVAISLAYLRTRIANRLKRFDDGLFDMLTMVSNSLRAGHSFAQAIQIVHDDMYGPLREEMGRILGEMQVGVSLEEAFNRAADRIGSEDFSLIVIAITIQRQVGGNLAEVLEKISETIRERVHLAAEVKALTSQGRMSAIIFMVMPPVVGLMMFFMNPPYIELLFQSPIGVGMLIGGAISQGLGLIFIRKVIRIEA